MLVVNEAVQNTAFNQITFGLTDGWWLFAEAGDPERVGQDSPLLCWQQWASLLFDCGFSRSRCLQGGSFLRVQAVIVAQRDVRYQANTEQYVLAQGAHFFTGGLGGLGLLTARLLVEVGAMQLILTSRSDRVVAGCDDDFSWFSKRSVNVLRMRCDASDDGNTRGTMIQLLGNGVQFSGVFHAAHQLADGILSNQRASNFCKAYGPKVHGASAIHMLTLRDTLCVFSVFSSAAGLMGSAGQAPHSAANAWLNTVASYRRSVGWCGQSISWGAVAEIGYAARAGADRRADLSGSGAISRRVATLALTMSFLAAVNFAVLPADWSKLLSA